jgi:fatty acid synthase
MSECSQVALTDMLQMMGVHPDGIIGHSTGEMCCGYADGCVTREQVMLLAFHRGNTVINSNLGKNGGMAAVGLTWEDAIKRCPKGVVPVCHNGLDSVTISGKASKVQCWQLLISLIS